MILLVLALAFLAISTFFVYKTAKENGYNAILWAIVSFSTFVGVYLVLSIAIVVVIAIGMSFFGWSNNAFASSEMLIDLVVMVVSGASVMLILRHVAKIKDEEYLTEELPPPPTF